MTDYDAVALAEGFEEATSEKPHRSRLLPRGKKSLNKTASSFV